MSEPTEHDPSKLQSITEKVMALLAKAQSTEFPEEAEALTAAAAKLQAKYAIDAAMLRKAASAASFEIGEKALLVKGTYEKALLAIAAAVGNGKGFKVLQNRNTRAKISWVFWIGPEGELEDAEVLYTSLLIQAEQAATAFLKDWAQGDQWYWEDPTPRDRFIAKRTFLLAFAQGVFRALKEAAVKAKAEYDAEHGDATSTALVLVERADEIEQWTKAKYPKTGKARNPKIHQDAVARRAGHQAGAAAVAGASRGQLGGAAQGQLGG